MDDSSGYGGCGSEIESVSDAAKIANTIVADAGEGRNMFREWQCRVKYETEIFGRDESDSGVKVVYGR